MQINTKYDIGQELYRIAKLEDKEIICECCGEITYESAGFSVRKEPYKVTGVIFNYYGFGNAETKYQISHNSFRDSQKEFDIDREGGGYFTTYAAAQAEADRRNAELKGD